jgi:tetratricopeptide (TPR) repeat protein
MKSWPRIGRLSFGLGHLVFVVVFLLRMFVLDRLSRSPFLLPSGGDMHFYDDWAQRILHGQIREQVAFYGLPGYPYLLALFYKFFGHNPFVPGLVQAGIDAGIAVLIYRLALRTCLVTSRLWKFAVQDQSRTVGMIAALGWALFVPAQAYSVILMPTVWFVFLFWFVVWWIVKNDDPPTRKECFWLGLLIGFTAMGVATILSLLPLVLAALLLKSEAGPEPSRRIDNRKRGRRIALGAALLLGGVGLGTSPCWIHNCFIARDPVLLSAHSGINFWIGNNPTANGYPRFPPGLRAGQAAMLEDSISQAEVAAGHSLKRSEVSAYWSAEAKNYIVGRFGDWLKLVARKLRNFWNAFQYDDLSIITNLREQGVVLPGIYLGLIAALAIPGMLFGWWTARRSRWVIAGILVSMVALLPVFITERYRLVAVPGLLIFAAFGLSVLWQSLGVNHFQVATLYLALLVGSTGLVVWPQKDASLWALDAYNSGWQALESNNLDLADKKLGIAYAYVSDNTEIVFALGNLRLAQANPDAAAAFYRAALAIDPKHKGALNNLGVLELERGRYGDAELWFRRAKDVDPRNAKTYYLLAKTFLAESNRPAATNAIEKAIKLNPEQREFAALREEIYKSN